MKPPREITIGQLADRTGLAASAIRFYEAEGLVHPGRTSAGQRRFSPSDIRRLSFVMVAVDLGFRLSDIRQVLDGLPGNRAPTARDWARIGRGFRAELDRRIALMERLRDRLDGCIGCGCLSLAKCRLFNPDDRVAARGPGPRNLIDPPDGPA